MTSVSPLAAGRNRDLGPARDPDLWRVCTEMCPGGSLWDLTSPAMSNEACLTLGMLQEGAMIDDDRRGRIMRAYWRGVWTLLTGRTLPEHRSPYTPAYIRDDAGRFRVIGLTPDLALHWPCAGSA